MHVKRIMEKYWNQTFKIEYCTRFSTMNVCADKKKGKKREKTTNEKKQEKEKKQQTRPGTPAAE